MTHIGHAVPQKLIYFLTAPQDMAEGFYGLFFHNLQDLHGAALDTNATGNALACCGAGNSGGNHNVEGADFCALPAAGAELLVDHVHSRLGILGNGAELTCLGALATLDTGQRLRGSVLLHNLDTGLILMEFLVEGL